MGIAQILSLASIILGLVKTAEQLFTGAGQGSEKKKMVMGAASVIVEGAALQGRIKPEEKTPILDALGGLVDETVALGNDFQALKPEAERMAKF